MSLAHTEQSLKFAKFFDHTLLKPDATQAQIEVLCIEARQNLFCTVCVNASWIPLATRLLNGSGVLPISVVGFPLGATLTRAKVLETAEAIAAGAREIDMVLNVGFLKSGLLAECEKDVHDVVLIAGSVPVKVILETSLLSPDEIATAAKLCEAAGAAFIKTSTGFGTRGANIEDIRIMKKNTTSKMRIKASGGIRTLVAAEEMIEAGAHRIGSSSSVQILADWCAKSGISL
ncbi:MAG: deoxyribose-phosphate aldolase [Bdellovibrionota bacterium]